MYKTRILNKMAEQFIITGATLKYFFLYSPPKPHGFVTLPLNSTIIPPLAISLNI